jgi:hypothetical protein
VDAAARGAVADADDENWLLTLAPPAGEPVTPLSDAPTRTLALNEMGPGPVGWGVAAARRAADYIIAVLPAFGGDPAAEELLRRAVESTTLAALRALLRGEVDPLWPGAEPADATASYARRGISLQEVIRGIHLCQEMLTRSLLGEIERQHRPVAAAQTASDVLFRCFDLFTANIAARYSLEAERWSQSTAAMRAELIETVLAGSNVDSSQLSTALDYDLEGEHVASVVWLDAPFAGVGAQDELDSALDRLDARLGAAPSLRRWVGPSTVHVWHQDRAGQMLGRLRATVDSPLPQRRARIALGDRGSGIAGFRSSHAQAVSAARLAGLAGGRLGWLVDYESVELLALVCGDLDQARTFVHRVLGPLGRSGPRSAELRQTLESYLQAGRSVARAARELHTHRNTVVYRIKKIEELFGGEMPARSGVEVRVALRIAALLDEVVLQHGPEEDER